MCLQIVTHTLIYFFFYLCMMNSMSFLLWLYVYASHFAICFIVSDSQFLIRFSYLHYICTIIFQEESNYLKKNFNQQNQSFFPFKIVNLFIWELQGEWCILTPIFTFSDIKISCLFSTPSLIYQFLIFHALQLQRRLLLFQYPGIRNPSAIMNISVLKKQIIFCVV